MKKILAAVLCMAVCLTLFAGCGKEDKPTLKVYNWGDYIDESVLEMFEEEFDCKIVYDTFEQNEDLYTKISTSGAVYDVIIPSDYMIERMISEDMLEPLNKENIPNLEYIMDYCMDLSFDPGNVYSVPYMWGTVGIVYNESLVTTEIDSWTDLWDETYERNLFMMNSVRDSMMVAMAILGYDFNTRDEAKINEAFELLQKQQPLVLSYTGDEVKDKMISGEAALCVMYSGDAVTVMDPDEGNADLKYIVPKEGTNIWFDNMCIVKGSENKELAEKFINFMCRKDVAALNREYINYCTPQTQVYDELDEETMVTYPTEDILSRSYVYKDLQDVAVLYDQLWTKIIVG